MVGEILQVAHMMNLYWEELITILDGEPVAILIVEVEPEHLAFEENLHNDV